MAMRDVHAILLAARGGRLTSPGLYTMASRLQSMGAVAQVYGSSSWAEQAAILASGGHSLRRIVLIGYSLGGMRAADMCNKLASDAPGIEIALLFTIVPPKRQISFNVMRAVNHTVPGGHAYNWWSDRIEYVDPRHSYRMTNHEYAAVAGLSHYTMQFHPTVHANLEAEVRRL